MQGVTLTIAIIASLLVITLRPSYALAVYITALLWYPSYLVVSIGTIDISVGRIVVAVLLFRCLCDSRILSKFSWSRLDTWVTLSMVVYVGVVCVTRPLLPAIENRGGFLMDTWLAYIVARFIITDRATLISIIKCVSIVLVPIAILGLVESVTGWQPFLPLRRFCPWYGEIPKILEKRWGLTRATGPFSHPISFGGGFAMFLPLIYFLRQQKSHWLVLAYVLSGVTLIGALSSMSSGPGVMVIVVIFCLAMEKHKHWVKPLLIFFASSCIFIGVASNRSFYHVIASYGNPLGGAGWHRARLIDCAIEHFDEWYLAGYGNREPGWGEFLGQNWTDVTNHFILAGVSYGILGVAVLCGLLITAFRGLSHAYKKTADPEMKSLCWSLGSILFAVAVVWMSVSFLGQLESLFYCILGMVGSLCNSNFNWEVQNGPYKAQNCPYWAVR